MAKIYHGDKGFQITFDNGYTASVQYGALNYCERRDKPPIEVISKDFELAVWGDRTKPWIPLTSCDDVKGYIPIELLPDVLACVRDARFDDLLVTVWHRQRPGSPENRKESS